MTTNLVAIFNNHFFEFVEDVENVFPDNPDILVTKNTLLTIKKANPKILVKIWNKFIVNKYDKEIEEGNIDFFIDKDYSHDLSNMDYSDKITEAIDRLREPIKQMNKENQEKSMKYIQNLTKIANIYENS